MIRDLRNLPVGLAIKAGTPVFDYAAAYKAGVRFVVCNAGGGEDVRNEPHFARHCDAAYKAGVIFLASYSLVYDIEGHDRDAIVGDQVGNFEYMLMNKAVGGLVVDVFDLKAAPMNVSYIAENYVRTWTNRYLNTFKKQVPVMVRLTNAVATRSAAICNWLQYFPYILHKEAYAGATLAANTAVLPLQLTDYPGSTPGITAPEMYQISDQVSFPFVSNVGVVVFLGTQEKLREKYAYRNLSGVMQPFPNTEQTPEPETPEVDQPVEENDYLKRIAVAVEKIASHFG